jgi:hypothetical protein
VAKKKKNKTLHKNLKIEQHEPNKNPGMNSGAQEE